MIGYLLTDGSDDQIRYNNGSFGRNGGGITACNNNIHHTFQEGIALELFEDCSAMEDWTISGNLMEYCTQAIRLCSWDEEAVDRHIFRNVAVEESLVLDSGWTGIQKNTAVFSRTTPMCRVPAVPAFTWWTTATPLR